MVAHQWGYPWVKLLLRRGANAHFLTGEWLGRDYSKEQRLRLLDLLKDHGADYKLVPLDIWGQRLSTSLFMRPSYGRMVEA